MPWRQLRILLALAMLECAARVHRAHGMPSVPPRGLRLLPGHGRVPRREPRPERHRVPSAKLHGIPVLHPRVGQRLSRPQRRDVRCVFCRIVVRSVPRQLQH